MENNDFTMDVRKYRRKSLRKLKRIRRSLFLKSGLKESIEPAFFIIGAQKSGTTSLFEYINTFASNFAPPLKVEIHYYDFNYHRNSLWYKSHYPFQSDKNGNLITGESSPYYLFHPATPARISKDFPNARFIVLLRNPIDRAFSQYNFQKAKSIGPDEPLLFEEAIQKEEERLKGESEKLLNSATYRGENHQYYSYLARGRYVEQLKKWFEYFNRDQFLIIQSERFFSDTEKKLMKVFNWLGLNRNNKQLAFKKFNQTKYDKLDEKLRIKLRDYYEPYNAQLFDLIKKNFNWQ